MKRKHFLKNLFFCLFPFTFFGLLVICVGKFSVNIPYMDEWALVPYLQKAYEGSLSIYDLFAQHNESRMFFPKLLIITLARITNWNICYEIACNVLIAAATFLLLAHQSIRTNIANFGKNNVWLVIFLSALTFSVLQYECWTLGFSVAGYMNIFFVVLGLIFLCHYPFSWLSFSGSLLAGTMATYSYINGIGYWIIGVPALMASMREEKKQRVLPYIIWLLFAMAILTLYFSGYIKNPYHPSLLFPLKAPSFLFSYLFTFIGSAIVNVPHLSNSVPITIGVIGLLIFGICWLICFYSAGKGLKYIAFWLGISAYALVTCLAVVIGRAEFGPKQALASRYTVLSSLFWAATLVLATITIESFSRQPITAGKRSVLEFIKKILFLFTAICAIFFASSSFYAIKAWKQHFDSLQSTANELLCFNQDRLILERSFPNMVVLKQLMPILQKNKLSIFRQKKSFSEYQKLNLLAGNAELLDTDIPPATSFSDGRFLFRGHAYDSTCNKAAQAVLLVDTNNIIIGRSSVIPARNRPSTYKEASWLYSLPARKLPAGKSEVQIYSLLQDGSRIAQIGSIKLNMVPAEKRKQIFRISHFIKLPYFTTGFLDEVKIEEEDNREYILCRGWARNPLNDKRGKWVAVTHKDANILAYCRVGDRREDVAIRLFKRHLLNCGWHLTLPLSALPPGTHKLKAYLFLPEQEKAFQLNNTISLTIP